MRVAERKQAGSRVVSRSDDPLGLRRRAGSAVIEDTSGQSEHLTSAKSSRKSDLINLIQEGRTIASDIPNATPHPPAQRSTDSLQKGLLNASSDAPPPATRYKRMSLARASEDTAEALNRAEMTGSTGSLMSGTYQRRRSTKDGDAATPIRHKSKKDVQGSDEVMQEVADADPSETIQVEYTQDANQMTITGKSKKKKSKKKREGSDPSDAGDGKKKRKSKSKGIKSETEGGAGSDADNESDPFDEFREATEKAELEMMETYVARAKWETAISTSHEDVLKLLFLPEQYVLPPSESLTALFESLRFPDEEGLYVGQYPPVKAANLTKMERRLRASEDNYGSGWFAPNQHLAALPLPKRARTQRPGAPPPVPVAQAGATADSTTSLSRSSVSLRYIEDQSMVVEDSTAYFDNMGLVLRKPHTTTPFCQITDTQDGYYSLVFSLGCVAFTQHPLMTEECKLAKEVEEWIYQLRARKKTDLVGFLSRKLEALKIAFMEYTERTERILASSSMAKVATDDERDGIYPAKPTHSKYYETNVIPREEEEKERIRQNHIEKQREFREDIRSTRLLRDAEAYTNRLLEFKILQAWERIKKLRKKTNCVTSSLRVLIRAKPAVTSIEEDRMQFHHQVESELLELEDLHDAEMERKRRQYKALMKEWRKRRAAELEAERKDGEGKENSKMSKRRMLLGLETDPLEESDEGEGFADDGVSGHEWLRRSSQEIQSKVAGESRKSDKRAKRMEAMESDRERSDAAERRGSLWDAFRGRSPAAASRRPTVSTPKAEEVSILDTNLEDSGRHRDLPPLSIQTKRTRSKPRASLRNDEIMIDSAFVASPQKMKTPVVRKRDKGKPSNEEESDVLLSKSSLGSQSSLRMNEDVKKWRSASRDVLDEPLKLRRPSVKPASPDRLRNPSIVPAELIRMRRKSVMIDSDTVMSPATDQEVVVRKRGSSKPKSPKRKSKRLSKSAGIFGSSDSMPVAPVLEEFDVEKARREIVKRLDSSMRPPGAPILSISHVFTEHPTAFLQCPKDEQLRRREVEATNVYICMFYNNKEITRTMPRPLDMERFTATFKGIETVAIDENPLDSPETRLKDANVFGVRVKEKPDSIRIEFHETGTFGNQYIGEVFVPIPDAGETVRQRDREFQSIGFSGRPFSDRYSTSTAARLSDRWIEGIIKLNVAWGVDDDGKHLGPSIKPYRSAEVQGNSKFTDPLCVSGASGLLNLRKLMDWIVDIKFDPNDPRNADVLRLKQLVQMGGSNGLSFHEYWSQRKYFRLHIPSRINQITLGVGVDGATDSKRLTLLRKRHKKEVFVKGPVPFDDKDITDEIFDKIANPLEDHATALALWKPKSSSKQPEESTDLSSQNLGFLKRIRMHQLIQRALQGRPPRVEDFVREERLAEVQVQENFLLSLFMPKRPLKPSRISRLSRLTAQPEDGCKIVCQVLRGFNVPIRKQDYNRMEDEKERITVRSYVEVSFQGRKTRTSVFDGPSPHWNETLYLDLKPPNNDFRPEKLLDSDVGMERIYFNIFDELLVDIVEDDRNREVEIHQRKERNWLGTFSIPFAALYEQSRIEGSFHVQIPSVLLGYEKNPSAGPLDNTLFLALEPTKETLIDVFISLEPPLLQPAPLKLRFLSDENDRFLRYAANWSKPLFLHPQRQFMATALDLSGRTTFICRYIRPQEPPEELLTPRHLLRFISSIPYLPDRTAFSADVSLWATSSQMLEIGAGDAAEHAILLCNFLIAKGGENIEAYVVIGHGIPEGRTAYVALRAKTGQNTEVTLMNATTGQSYSVRDPHLPLKVVGCMFNDQNVSRIVKRAPQIFTISFLAQVWANIQAHDDPARIIWNVNAPKFWKPFFCKSFPKTDYKSVQV
ncbi:Coiled-coil and C2 domain-containing protein 2A [Podochytrium sp. JEL0797]|nr:Coiled-coil and C2 domain-containing protein 2A [Podochytrium sp. JEL0797]